MMYLSSRDGRYRLKAGMTKKDLELTIVIADTDPRSPIFIKVYSKPLAKFADHTEMGDAGSRPA